MAHPPWVIFRRVGLGFGGFVGFTRKMEIIENTLLVGFGGEISAVHWGNPRWVAGSIRADGRRHRRSTRRCGGAGRGKDMTTGLIVAGVSRLVVCK